LFGTEPEQIRQNIEYQRTNGNRFCSLVVGDCFMAQRLTSLFDHEWVYDPYSSQIHELIGFQLVWGASTVKTIREVSKA